MQPTLAGDVLLLAVGDKARLGTRGGVEPVLAGALVGADALAGRTPSRLPPGPQRRKEVRAVLATRTQVALREVADPLVAAGVLGPAEHTLLGFVLRRGFTVVDRRARVDAENRLRAGLLTPTRDPHLAVLAVLCAVSGIASSVLPAPTERQARRAVAAHLNGLRAVVGPEVAEVLVATRDAYRRQHRDGGTFVPDSGRDPYGDSGGDGGGGGGGDGGGDGGGGGGD